MWYPMRHRKVQRPGRGFRQSQDRRGTLLAAEPLCPVAAVEATAEQEEAGWEACFAHDQVAEREEAVKEVGEKGEVAERAAETPRRA
mmetsp:Transcript_22568/g.73352  ORF Transcript_22568/g.73352 Transcript_22568/m.73352 type:complete len:87 (-) Transcript_22568:2088-2348(-)